ncbi:MAG: FAD-dependent oxidoreductase [Pirellulaceae bacterium]
MDYDIVVVGGGIHGVGVAQAAAAAGYSTLLLEQTDLAAGTSSKSSKLIHGGLRYLESWDFRLVRESLLERELLIRLAPDLVRRQAFYIPVYPETTRRPWKLRAGLALYSLFAGLGQNVRFRTVARREWSSLDGLETKNLQKVFQYWDAQTDDRELTKAVMQSAIELGAVLHCPAEFVSAQRNDKSVSVSFRHESTEHRIQTAALVNAAGPWATEVGRRIQPAPPMPNVDLVQGTHLELPDPVSKGCYYLESPTDQRAIFVIPWKGHTMLGTTETVHHQAPELARPLEKEQSYLLDVYQHFFPDRPTEVVDQWAGLRVLPAATGAAFKRSRETQLPVDQPREPRIVSIFGGKLTAYRATAEKVMTVLAASLPKRNQIARTNQLQLKPVPNRS